MADILEQKRDELAGRLAELAPVVVEYERLTAAVDALATVASPSANGAAAPVSALASPRRRRGRSRGSASSVAAGLGAGGMKTPKATEAGVSAKASRRRTRRRRKGSGTRADEALVLIQNNPGVTVPEMAEIMGAEQTGVYHVVSKLLKEDRIRKDGRGLHLKETARAGA